MKEDYHRKVFEEIFELIKKLREETEKMIIGNKNDFDFFYNCL